MIKIFFATFFIAELIIAIAVILKIRQFNKCVNSLNTLVCSNHLKIRFALIDFRIMLEDFSSNIQLAKDFISRKRKEYTLRALKTSLIYTSIFFLKGKYKKTIFAYQLVREIYDGINDSDF